MGAVRAARPANVDRQIRALLASKIRDAADVARSNASITVTTGSCLTSATDFGFAAAGTGLLFGDSDEVRINHVRFKGIFELSSALLLNPTGLINTVIRRIVVWFNKPLLVASAAATLPPITEVLVTDSVNSLEIGNASNAGRFVILSDRYFKLGTNTFQAVTAVGHARCNGANSIPYDYTVQVGRMCKYVAPSDIAFAGGHYDSDSTVGRVSSGLLMCYTLFTGAQVASDVCRTRLNYTS